jgi:prophage regulatory protein
LDDPLHWQAGSAPGNNATCRRPDGCARRELAGWPDEFRKPLGSPAFYFAPREPVTGASHMAAHLITYDDLPAKGIRFSKPHLWKLEKANKFPKRVPISDGRYAYVESEIDEYVDRMIAARDAKLAVAAA